MTFQLSCWCGPCCGGERGHCSQAHGGSAEHTHTSAGEELLTPDELAALDLSADLANLFGRIIGNGTTRSGDWSEVAGHIHTLQHLVMAQAAARAYPDRFRLLGDVIPATHTPRLPSNAPRTAGGAPTKEQQR